MTTYALFTGCRLGDCEPELVVKLYDSLRFQIPDIDINCMCCGVSALKEDDMTGADEMAVQIRTSWEKMGRPTFVCACPTCIKTLNEKLPEIPTVSLYKTLIDLGISGGCATFSGSRRADSWVSPSLARVVNTFRFSPSSLTSITTDLPG